MTDFFENMNEEDHFGMISLDETDSMYDIMLEPRHRHPTIKKNVLKRLNEREFDFVSHISGRKKSKNHTF